MASDEPPRDEGSNGTETIPMEAPPPFAPDLDALTYLEKPQGPPRPRRSFRAWFKEFLPWTDPQEP